MRTPSRKLLLSIAALLLLAFVVYRSSGLIPLAGFSGAKLLQAVRDANIGLLGISLVAIYGCYALRAVRWKRFQESLGPANFWTIYKLTLGGFAAVFTLGRAGEPVRPLLLARKERLPVADMFGIYALERLFDAAATAVIAGIGLWLFQSHAHEGAAAAAALQKAARSTGVVLFLGVIGAVAFLVYLRLHGTSLLQRRLKHTVEAHGWKASLARTILGFTRGVQAIRNGTDLFFAVFYSAVHWFVVLAVYVWVSHAFGGTLATLSWGDCMLVMAFTLAGSAVQLPGVGGGSQAGTIIAYTAIFGVEREPAVAAAIVVWLISFASVSIAGIPLLIHEGWSLGDLRRVAQREDEIIDQAVTKDRESAATPGESTE
jgi:uncharacterized protein (TIRG00374 family)